MTTPKYIIVLLTFFFLYSCGKTIRLSEKDFRWIPYKGNETLVFNSNTGDTDTIFLTGTKRDTSPTDPLDMFPTNLEHYIISSTRSDPSPPSGNHRYLEGSVFVELSASEKKNNAFLSFDLTTKDSWFYGNNSSWSLKTFDTLKGDVLQTKVKTYYDIIIVTPDTDEYIDRSNFLTKVYWSKSEGLIRFDKKDSVYWELTKKYSP
jgi:hypothetical protein